MQPVRCLQDVQGHLLRHLRSLLLASPAGWVLLMMHDLAVSSQTAKIFTLKCIPHRRYDRMAGTAASAAASCCQCFCSDTLGFSTRWWQSNTFILPCSTCIYHQDRIEPNSPPNLQATLNCRAEVATRKTEQHIISALTRESNYLPYQ